MSLTIEPIQQLISAVETADSADQLLDTVKALAATKSEGAIPTLIKVLGYNNPGAAVAAVDGLIAIGEATVPLLLQSLDDYNYGARAWAIRVFAGIGEPITLDLLLRAASTDFSLSVRRAAARGLGFIRWQKMLPTEVLPAQLRSLETLLLASQDGEWVVRYAAVVGLASLYEAIVSDRPNLAVKIRQRCQEIATTDTEMVVRARVKRNPYLLA
jgi:phycocyanobilin lyase subunit beta